ncbi:MAG: Uma2 family endonuclease [Crocosphaera sp.]
MKSNTVTLSAPLNLDIDLTDEQFFELCQNNRDLRFERTATGQLIIMPPTGSETSDRNAELTYQLRAWNRQSKLGKSFDSSGGFKLPNGAERSPDASWIHKDQWNGLTPAEKEKFAPLCPDFVVELMSPSDSLEKTRLKMQEYMENGARLGWLINRRQKQVEIYRPDQEVEILQNPQFLSGETVLPDFSLDLTDIW